MRTCKTCLIEKPLDAENWPIRSLPSGNQSFRPVCKACTNDALREKARERMRKGRGKDGGSSSRKAVKKWKTANKPMVRGMREGAIHQRVPLQQRPRWAGRPEMQALYRTARMLRDMGQDAEVDHIIPLKGELVCGLHVLNNLRLCPRAENTAKGSSFDPSSWIEPVWS